MESLLPKTTTGSKPKKKAGPKKNKTPGRSRFFRKSRFFHRSRFFVFVLAAPGFLFLHICFSDIRMIDPLKLRDNPDRLSVEHSVKTRIGYQPQFSRTIRGLYSEIRGEKLGALDMGSLYALDRGQLIYPILPRFCELRATGLMHT